MTAASVLLKAAMSCIMFLGITESTLRTLTSELGILGIWSTLNCFRLRQSRSLVQIRDANDLLITLTELLIFMLRGWCADEFTELMAARRNVTVDRIKYLQISGCFYKENIFFNIRHRPLYGDD